MKNRLLSFLLLTLLLASPILAQVASVPEVFNVSPQPAPWVIAREKADQGDAQAQVQLATFYFQGIDLPQDCREAIKWLRRAADQRNAEAIQGLGTLFDDGVGLTQDCKDHREAVHWYKRSALVGNVLAEVAEDRLAVIYESGDGVPQNHAEALKWFKKALARKDYGPYYRLTYMYYHGSGVKQNYVAALMWANLGAEVSPNSKSISQQNKLTAVEMRDEIAAKLTPKQIAEAERLAQRWKSRQRKGRLSRFIDWLVNEFR